MRSSLGRMLKFGLLLLLPSLAFGQIGGTNFPINDLIAPAQFGVTIQIVILMTILALAPSILIMMTSFTRIVVIFHFLRQAIGTQNTPSNQILISLALFMTFFVMRPVLDEVYDNALQPYLDDQITQQEALEFAAAPIRAFMLSHTREKELELFASYADGTRPASQDDISFMTIVPAFMISELRIAFQIGFMLYLPMLLVDMVVASVLMSMGMMMLPPVMISMPFKILLFVIVDGWYLVVESIINGLR